MLIIRIYTDMCEVHSEKFNAPLPCDVALQVVHLSQVSELQIFKDQTIDEHSERVVSLEVIRECAILVNLYQISRNVSSG